MAKVNDNVIKIATKLIYNKGFSSLTFSELSRMSEIPETTLRRHFKGGKASIFTAVLESASRMISDEFVTKTEKANLSIEVSEPKKLILLYAQTVLELAVGKTDGSDEINERNLKTWQTRLLFSGCDGTQRGYAEEVITHDSMQDIDILDDIILRGCGDDKKIALSASCIILGTIIEYTHAKDDKPFGYVRKYEMALILKHLDTFLSSIFQNPTIQSEELENQGISTELLKRLSNELRNGADAIDRTLNDKD